MLESQSWALCSGVRSSQTARDFHRLRFDDFGWDQGVVATGAAGAVAAVSADNCKRYVLLYCSRNKLLP